MSKLAKPKYPHHNCVRLSASLNSQLQVADELAKALFECKACIKVLDRKREHQSLDEVIEHAENALAAYDKAKGAKS